MHNDFIKCSLYHHSYDTSSLSTRVQSARPPLCLQNQNIMGKTNQRNIQKDEDLAEEVRQYSCLYDKSNSEYKDAPRKKLHGLKLTKTGKGHQVFPAMFGKCFLVGTAKRG